MSNYNQLKIKYDGGSQTAITLSSNIINPNEYQGQDIVTVEVPEIVTEIGEYAFCDNNNLFSIILNEGLQTINGQVFQHGIYSSITIPSTVTYIGMNAFNIYEEQEGPGGQAGNLTIYCLATTPPMLNDSESRTFGNPSKITAIYVPSGSVSDYQQDWPQYASKIQAGAPPAAEPATTKNILKAFVGSEGVEKMYLGSELVWEPTNPVPVYSAMPITMQVLSAGTIEFKPYNSTAYTADEAIFIPLLNGVNIGDSMVNNMQVWHFEPNLSISPKTVNVQEGDVFQIYRMPITYRFNRLGNGNNQNGSSSAYYTFSGSTAGIELFGNILSMCMDPTAMTAYTRWEDACYENGTHQDTRYAVCGLFRYMTGLVSAENLWLPNDVPPGGYLNLFNRCQALVTPPKIFPAEIVTPWCYGSTFNNCTSLPESPIIAATGYTTSGYWRRWSVSNYGQDFYTMFSGCTNMNKITCFMNQTNMSQAVCNGLFYNWVTGVARTGNFYKRNGAGWYSGANGYPTNWTMNIYQE